MPDTGQAARYRDIRRLGVGGMATVTLAEDTVLGRPVALKRVHGGGDSRGMLRLKREAMVGASLNHPNLVFVYDARVQDDGDVVIVMEYVEGETLADVLHTRGALPASEAIRVLRGVAAALDVIHEQGIVHRDVKPANVLLGRDGTIKLADLGVADVADRTRITESGAVVGSFSYMAPEQLEGAEPSPSMDIYALAAVAYEILSGQRARPETNPLALAHAIATQPAPDLRSAWPAAPAAAAAVLQRGMSADPAERPASAGKLVDRVASALEPEPPARIAPRPRTAAAPPVPAALGPRRRPLLAAALLALVAALVAAVILVTLSGGGHKSSGSATSAQRGTTTHHHAARPATTASSSTATTGASTATTGTTTATTGTTAATNSTPAANPGTTAPAASAAPAGAVEQFYTAAAQHQYQQAWALADSNLRSQLGGYAAFEHLMSSVRSITFHRAETVSGSGANAATVAVSTTSVQTDRTQQCTGTARTVRSGSSWLVDRIAINCS